jgi:hypothetical protein
MFGSSRNMLTLYAFACAAGAAGAIVRPAAGVARGGASPAMVASAQSKDDAIAAFVRAVLFTHLLLVTCRTPV